MRKIYWKFFGKKVYKVTCPTIATLEKLKSLNIFDQTKLYLLHDPVISPKTIVIKKNELIDSKYDDKKIIIAIGRLTRQKNFSFLLHCFALIKKKHPDYHLLILGSEEEENKLKKIIRNLEISNSVDLLGYKENPYKYLSKAECFILSSLWVQVQSDVKINEWFGQFYDMIQKALAAPNSITIGEYWASLLSFITLAGIYVALATVVAFFTSHYLFRWRTAMIDWYHSVYDKARTI